MAHPYAFYVKQLSVSFLARVYYVLPYRPHGFPSESSHLVYQMSWMKAVGVVISNFLIFTTSIQKVTLVTYGLNFSWSTLLDLIAFLIGPTFENLDELLK